MFSFFESCTSLCAANRDDRGKEKGLQDDERAAASLTSVTMDEYTAVKAGSSPVSSPPRKRGSVNRGRNKLAGDLEEKCDDAQQIDSTAALSKQDKKDEIVPEQTPETPNDGFRKSPASTFPGEEQILSAVENSKNIFEIFPHQFGVVGITVTTGSHGSAKIAPDFTEKELETSGGTTDQLRAKMEELGMAVCCKKGRKPEQPNQDNCFLLHTGSLTLVCVADGHGKDGHWVSHWVARTVLYLSLLEVQALGGGAPGQESLTNIFSTAHQVLRLVSQRDNFDIYLSGTTLTVCVLDRGASMATVAWCGDSRATIALPTGKAEAFSKDHKPQDPKEKVRIVQSGGEVVRLDGDIPYRVFKKGADTPGLAMSRAVGDLAGHEVGVSNEPEIRRSKLEPGSCLLCCSDGVWEFIKNSEAAKKTQEYGRSQVRQAAERLVKDSSSKWLQEDPSVTDDITAILIYV